MGQLGVEAPLNILSLDGGGSLGVYTLGILTELEAHLGQPLHEVFDLIYGTSTGSIIGSMIALGDDVQTIKDRYFEIAPDVMGESRAKGKTRRLEHHATELYGEKTFDAFKVAIGIVTTDVDLNRPMIFKSDAQLAHRRRETFEPGFGCRIADAVLASSAAYPIFKRRTLETSKGMKTLVDGGFAANNPALLALTDATGPLCMDRADIRLLTLGRGLYPEKKGLLQRTRMGNMITTLLQTNAETIDGLRKFIFNDVNTVRVNKAFNAEHLRTNFTEADRAMLDQIFHCGSETFGEHEDEILALLRN